MKNNLLLAFICLLFSCGNSVGKEVFYYGELGGGYGNFPSFKLGINRVHNNNIFSIVYYVQEKDASNIPPDYIVGNESSTHKKPQQTIASLCFTKGKIFKVANGHIRFVLKGGSLIGLYAKPTNFTPDIYGWYGSNYDVKYKDYLVAGAIVNPLIEFPINRYYGFSTGLWANVNTGVTTYGVELNLLFGNLRPKIEKKSKR